MSYPSYPPNDDQPPVPPGATYGYGGGVPQAPRNNQLALWSMIIGIASLPAVCFCGFGIFLGVTAFVMGIIARSQISASQGTQSGDGQALAGIIVGGIGAVLSLLFLVSFLGGALPV